MGRASDQSDSQKRRTYQLDLSSPRVHHLLNNLPSHRLRVRERALEVVHGGMRESLALEHHQKLGGRVVREFLVDGADESRTVGDAKGIGGVQVRRRPLGLAEQSGELLELAI